MSAEAFELEPTNMKRCYQCDRLVPELSDTSRCIKCLQSNHDAVLKMNDSLMSKFAQLQTDPMTGVGEWIGLEDFVNKSLGVPGMVLDIAVVDLDYVDEEEPLTENDTERRVENVSIERVDAVINAMKMMEEACGLDGVHDFFLRTSKYNAVSLGEDDE